MFKIQLKENFLTVTNKLALVIDFIHLMHNECLKVYYIVKNSFFQIFFQPLGIRKKNDKKERHKK